MLKDITNHSTNLLVVSVFACIIILVPFAHTDELVNGNQSAKYFLFLVLAGAFSIIASLQFLFNGLNSQKTRGIKSNLSNSSSNQFKPIQTTSRLTWLDIILFLYISWLFTNYIFVAKIPGISEKFYELIAFALFYIGIRVIPNKYNTYLILILLVSGIAQSVYGNLQLFGKYPSHHGLFNITGGFFNPGPYAGYLAGIFPVALTIYLFRDRLPKINIPDNKLVNNSFMLFQLVSNGLKTFAKSLTKQQQETTSNHLEPSRTFSPLLTKIFYTYLPAITLLSVFLVLPATRSRAAWVAVVLSSLFAFALRYNLIKVIREFANTNIKKLLLYIFLSCIMAGGIYGIYHFKKDSADGRLLIYKATTQMIKEKPVLGHGITKFKAQYMNYQANYLKDKTNTEEATLADDNPFAFNSFLKIFSETGVVGICIVFVVLLFFFLGKENNKSNKILFLTYAHQVGILGLIVFGMFSYPEEVIPIKVNAIFFLAMVAKQQKPIIKQRNRIVKNKLLFYSSKLSIVAICLAVIIFSTPGIKKLYISYQNWDEANLAYKTSLYEDSLEDYEKAYPMLRNNGDFLLNYGKACSMAGEHRKAIEILDETKSYLNNSIVFTALGDSYKALGKNTLAEKAYFAAWYMAPGKFYPKYLLAKLYDETGQTKKAVSTANELLNKKVKIHSTAIEEIKEEMNEILNNNSLKGSM